MNLLPLNLYLFGPLRIELNGAAVVSHRRKAQALLAYLAVTGQSHSRDALATLLWPEFSQSQARANLRRELAELRDLLGEERLLDDRVTVALNTAPPFALDLADFQQHLAQARQCSHPGYSTDATICPACLPHLSQAAACYTADFLAGFTLPDSPAFDDWHFFQADGLRQTLAQLLERLVQGHSAAQQFTEAIPFARRWVALDPLHEPAHCQLMLVYELAGQHAAARRQYESCVRVLDEELGVPPAEETTVLYEQIRQRVGGAGQPIHLPTWPLRQGEERLAEALPSAPPFQAPAPPPHFVGRDVEITQLCTALLQPNTPIYALVGMGGAGKTTLAMQVAHLLRDDFRDGVLWANAVSSDPMDIAAAWASAYDYDFGGLSDLESRAAALRGALAEKAVLLVLDNVDQAAGIRPLLPSGNHCAVLLTTRDLDAANALNAQVLFLGELSAENSRQLLVAILGAARVTNEEDAAAAIGTLLHYLPLAVEIVAQRLKSRPRQRLSQLVARLQDEAQRLDLAISDRAVRASFAVSWAALDRALQRCFALLGVFAGRPFAAEAIAHLAEAKVSVTEEWLFALEALSLVKAEGARYYRQHPLLADFAREKLVDGDGASGRMADYYYEFAQTNRRHYAALEPEWGNIMASIRTAYQQENWNQVITFTDALTKTWLTRARYNEARQAYLLAQEATLKLENDALQAANLRRWGEVCIEQNDYNEAGQLLTDSLALYYQLEDDTGIADAQYHLARIALERNQYEKASHLLAACLSIREELGDKRGMAASLFRQARLHYDNGPDYDMARDLAQKALVIQEAVGDKPGIVPTLRLLAQIAGETEQYQIAQAYGEQARALCEEIQDPGELATTLYVLIPIYRSLGNFKVAQELAEQSLSLFQQMGNRRIQAMVFFQMSLTYKATDQSHLALKFVQKSLAVFRELRDNLGVAYALRNLGDLFTKLGQVEQGKEAWLETESLAKTLNHALLLKSTQQRLGALSLTATSDTFSKKA